MSLSCAHRFVSASLLALVACGPVTPAEHAAKAELAAHSRVSRVVRSAPVSQEVWAEAIEVMGELLPLERALISAKAPGRLAEINVDIGTRVAPNALVARIEPRDAELRVLQSEAAVRAARTLLGLAAQGEDDEIDPEKASNVLLANAELEEARRTKERASTLSEGGVSSKAQLDAAETEFQAASARRSEALEIVENRRALLALRRADLAVARQGLEDTRILAPFEGAIVERLAGTGEYVSVGTPLFRIVRDGSLRLRMSVPEHYAALVHVGQDVAANITGVSAQIAAQIVRTSPELEARSRILVAEAEVHNPEGTLRPGTFAKARIVLDADARALCLPLAAVVSFAGVQRVFVIENGQAHEKLVTLGRRDAQRAEVLSGIADGARVILDPGNLRDGDPVSVGH